MSTHRVCPSFYSFAHGSRNGNLNRVKLLVEAGADITLTNKYGETPRQLANSEIGKYLDSVAQDTERTEALLRRKIRASFSTAELDGGAHAGDDLSLFAMRLQP